MRKPKESRELEEVARETARRSVWRPLLGAAGLTGATLALYAMGVRRIYGGIVVTSSEAGPHPVLFGLVGLALFLGSFWYFNRRQRASGESPFATGARASICNRCHESTLQPVGSACGCGGTHEPLEDWEWIEEESEGGTA